MPVANTALVTGASRGIGAAIARRLSDLGMSVISPTRAELDLADLEKVVNFARQNEDVVPKVLIINAGENLPEVIETVTTEHWLQTMNVNLNSAFVLMREFAPRMAREGGGWITAISSCYSLRSRRGRAPYSASKAGLNSLVKSAALEFATANILVNAVAPGFVMTDLTRKNNDEQGIKDLEARIPLGRLAEPEEVAQLVGYLSGPTNTYITGQLFVIDGGFLCQ
jgi:3-oxoacyl-[acyl-carrier protein] reductase